MKGQKAQKGTLKKVLYYIRPYWALVGLSVLLAAVTVGGGLFGLLGVLLSVPVASVVYALIKRDVRRRLTEQGVALEEPDATAPEEPEEKNE